MARAKTKLAVAVATLANAQAALEEIASLQRQVKALEVEVNEEIARLKARAEEQSRPWRERIEALERGLKAWAEGQKENLFAERRSVELTHGRVGFRRSTVLRTRRGTTWADVLGRLKELGRTDGIRVREDVDKEAVKAWPESELEPLGLTRHERDVFWYEVDEVELDDAV